MKKKITITANTEDIQKILNELCIPEITFTVTIEGDSNKEICKKLSGIPEIKDWDFLQSDIKVVLNGKDPMSAASYGGIMKTNIQENTSKAIEKFNSELNIDSPKVFDISEVVQALKETEISIPSNNELATLIEAIWRKGQSWSFGLGKNFIKGLPEVYSEVANSPTNLNHAMIGMILGSYYTNVPIEDAVKDTLTKIGALWDTRTDCQGVTGFVYAMYKNTPKN